MDHDIDARRAELADCAPSWGQLRATPRAPDDAGRTRRRLLTGSGTTTNMHHLIVDVTVYIS